MQTDLIAVRQQAEKAVRDMKDGPIKEKAFEVILSHLLAEGKAAIITASPTATTRSDQAHHQVKTKLKKGPMAQVALLISEGFFKQPKTLADVKNNLRDRGHNYPVTSLSPTLVALTQKKHLRRTKDKLTNKRKGFIYSNW